MNASESLQIIESYPDDEHLPGPGEGRVGWACFSCSIATDGEDGNVRVVIMYLPRLDEWEPDSGSGAGKHEVACMWGDAGGSGDGSAVLGRGFGKRDLEGVAGAAVRPRRRN